MLIGSLLVLALQVDPTLEAQKAFDALKLPKAEALAQQAIQDGGLDTKQFVRMLEIRALSAALQKRSTAKELFAFLLAVSPSYALPAKFGPRARTPFLEAKASVDAIELRATPKPELTRCIASIEDPLKFAADAVPLLQGSAEVLKPVAINAQQVAFDVPKGVDGCAMTLRDRYGNALRRFPDEGFWPMASKPEPVPVVLEPRLQVEPSPAPSKEVPTTASVQAPAAVVASGPGWRIASIVLGVLAVGASAGAVAFGLMSQQPRRTFETLRFDAEGRVTNLSQVDANQITAAAVQQAFWANVCWVAAGVLAAGAGTTLVASFL
jgi:hypothetical protein